MRLRPPEVIYIIRHGEKPQDLPAKHSAAHSGVDFRGNQNEHSLLPRGWQRSGALAALFDPLRGALHGALRAPLREGLRVPGMLISPSYGHAGKIGDHRTHETLRGLSDRLGIAITCDFGKGQEAQLAAAVLDSGCEVVLICWEHGHIPALASALPLAGPALPGPALPGPVLPGPAPAGPPPAGVIPQKWPDDRYDVIWTFTRTAGAAGYAFAQVPQLLLAGDSDSVIA